MQIDPWRKFVVAENGNFVIMDVLIAGATGLVGCSLLKLLEKENSVNTIYVLSRRALSSASSKVSVIITDFEELEEVLNHLPPIDAVFSCLGTTKSKTPDKLSYEKIEIHYPMLLANWAAKNGVEQFHYISSLGASVGARNEYLSRKGLAEQSIGQAGISELYFYRPSLIVGDRNEKRFLENISAGIFRVLNPMFVGSAKKYRSIRAEKIAKAMLHNLIHHKRGTHVLQSDQIESMA